MTEKRFVYIEHKGADYILDNPNWELDFIEMLGDTLEAEEIVDLLNEQHEQINTLRESRRELISANNEYRMRETELAQELSALVDENEQLKQQLHYDGDDVLNKLATKCSKLEKENEQLKKGMIRVVDRYIKNVECNPPSSARTYRKIKGALINIREDLRDLIERI